MPNTSKSTKKGPAAKAEAADVFVAPYLKGVTRVAELQKNSLDLAAEQSAEWFGAWKKAFSLFPVPSPEFAFDIAGQAIQSFIETEKNAIDLVVEQNHAVAEIAKQRAAAYTKIGEDAKATFKATVSRSVEAQKKVLEFAGAQSKAICEATKKQIGGGPAATFVDTFERGANTLLEAQKSVLDATAQRFEEAASA
jgi:hypothetical protein